MYISGIGKTILFVIILMVIGVISIVCLKPSCSDKGGKSVFSHYIYVWNGKFNQMVPVYDCVIDEGINKK